MRGVWSEALQCEWLGWRVVGEYALALDLPDGNCCDMTGAIKTAEALMPEVVRIVSFQGGENDTIYRKESTGWKAYIGSERYSRQPAGPAIPTAPNKGQK